MKRTRKQWTRQYSKFLDPSLEVGSSIRYRFSVESYMGKTYDDKDTPKLCRNVSLEVSLTDCSRTINWGGGFKQMRGKLETTIKILTRAVGDINALENKYNSIPVEAKDDDDI